MHPDDEFSVIEHQMVCIGGALVGVRQRRDLIRPFRGWQVWKDWEVLLGLEAGNFAMSLLAVVECIQRPVSGFLCDGQGLLGFSGPSLVVGLGNFDGWRSNRCPSSRANEVATLLAGRVNNGSILTSLSRSLDGGDVIS